MTKKILYIIMLAVLTVLISAGLFAIGFTHNLSSLARAKLSEETKMIEDGISAMEPQKAELSQKVEDIETELSTKTTVNNYYMEYQQTYETLKSEIDELKKQSEQLDSEIEAKKQELSSVSGVKSEETGKTYALKNDEVYSCPDKIPEGRYTASGSGTIIISSSTGKTRATKNLDVAYDNSYTFNLSDKEQIKVTGSVKLTELK